LAARAAGAHVVVLECAPREQRGGNSRHTRNLRCAHAAPMQTLTDAYSRAELRADLEQTNEGEADAELAVERSADCVSWLAGHGVRFQSALRGTLQLARTNAFFLGGGTAALNSL